MKAAQMMAVAVLAASGMVMQMVQAQQPGTKRTDLQRHDLSIPGREAIQVRVDIGPGEVAPRHRHPGEEIIYVLEGTLEYEVDGKPPVTLKWATSCSSRMGRSIRQGTREASMRRSSPRMS